MIGKIITKLFSITEIERGEESKIVEIDDKNKIDPIEEEIILSDEN